MVRLTKEEKLIISKMLMGHEIYRSYLDFDP